MGKKKILGRLPRPTHHLPGTAAKVEVMCRRFARREALFHPADARDTDLSRLGIVTDFGGNGHTIDTTAHHVAVDATTIRGPNSEPPGYLERRDRICGGCGEVCSTFEPRADGWHYHQECWQAWIDSLAA